MDFWGYVIPGYMLKDHKTDIYDYYHSLPYFEKLGMRSPNRGVICYPPSFYTLMLPFAFLPREEAADTWLILKYISLFWSGVILAHLAGAGRMSPVKRLFVTFVVAAGIYATHLFMDDISVGQVNIHVFLLLCLALYLTSRDKDVFAGVCLGLVFSIKLISAPIILYYLLKGRWKIVIPAAVTAGGLFGLSTLAFGPGIIGEFIRAQSHSFVQVAFAGNLSIQYRLMLLVKQNPQLVKMIYLAIALPIIGAAFFRLISLKDRVNPFYLFSLLTVTTTVIAPVVWSHHHVWFFIFLVFWARDLYARPFKGAGSVLSGILFLAIYFILAFLDGLFSQYYYYYEVFQWGIPFGMQMLVWLAVMAYPPERLDPSWTPPVTTPAVKGEVPA